MRMAVVPSNVVSHVSSLARTPVASEVAHAMREDAQRVEYKQTAGQAQFTGGSVKQDDPVRYDALGRDENGRIVTGGKVAGHDVDSEEAQRIVRNINTQTDLKINRLVEISGYLRWATIGLMSLTFGAWTAAATGGAGGFLSGLSTMSMATAAGAFAAGPFLGLLAASVVVGGIALGVSQRKQALQSNRWMDVQGFMQERTATKVGKEVAKAVTAAPERADGKQWQDMVRMSQAEAQMDEARGV